MNWISVKDMLPGKHEKVLVCDKLGGINTDHITWPHIWNSEWRLLLPEHQNKGFESNITHWMPLPKPPVSKKSIELYNKIILKLSEIPIFRDCQLSPNIIDEFLKNGETEDQIFKRCTKMIYHIFIDLPKEE